MTTALRSTPRTSLSKSRFVAGLQCERRLWLAVHRPELRAAPDAAQQARLDAGTALGDHAHRLFPGGVLVAEGPDRFAEARARTLALLADDSVPAIFEGAFEHRGVRVRVDVLERHPSERGFALVEVKSGTRVKDHLLDDLALQAFVLEGSGIPLDGAALLLVDPAYVRGTDGIDWPRLFERHELAHEVAARLPRVEAQIRAQHAVVSGRDEPAVEPAHHCRKPHPCPFHGHCTAGKPADWVMRLPRVRSETVAELRARGVERIRDIPEDVRLTPTQERAREVWRTGLPFEAPQLADSLEPFGPPAWYLDFETVGAVIPLWPGTRPYEAVPFQWSIHHVDARGRLTHWGHLADGRGDPRRELATSLVSRLGADDAPILVYSDYERGVLCGLAQHLPDLAASLAGLRARLRDLLPVVRSHVYRPEFHGSFSIKTVAPALVPGFAWEPPDADAAAITEGGSASAAFERIARGETSRAEERALVRGLQAYCRHDTRALVEVHVALRQLSA